MDGKAVSRKNNRIGTNRLRELPLFDSAQCTKQFVVNHSPALRTCVIIVALLTPSVSIQARAQSTALQPRGQAVTLDDVIRAVATNPGIFSARERVNAARGTLRTARTWANPTVNYEVENAPLPGSSSASLDREASIFATLSLEPIYQIGPRVSRARLELLSAEYDFADTRRATTLAASASFFRASIAQVAVRSATEVSAWVDSLIVYTRNRVREGATAEVDLLRLQVEQGRAEVDLAMARVELGRELAELVAITGIDADSVSVESPASLPTVPSTALSLESLTAAALARRPDLSAAAARARAAAAGVSIEQRAIIREVGAMAGVKNSNGERGLTAGLSVPFPLFDRNAGEIQRAKAEQRAAAFDRELVERRIISEVRTAFAARNAFEAAVTKSRDLVSRAEESRRIAEAAYREGAIPLSQVIEAIRALGEARESYAKAYFGWRQSLFELNSSTTGLPQESTR